MNEYLKLQFQRSKEFLEALQEKDPSITFTQKVRVALEKYKDGSYSLEEAIDEAVGGE